MAVHVVGNVALDTTFRLARFPQAGETVNAVEASVALGGKGANQALAALRAGAATTLWSAVGEDADAATIRRGLAEAGLSDRGLCVVEAPSDRSTILVDGSGENQIVSAVACARTFDPLAGGWQSQARRGDLLVLQGNLTPRTTRALLEAARALALRTILNASPLGSGPPGADEPMPLGADILVVNRGEGEWLTGESKPAAMAARLLAEGAEAVVVTLGAGGVLYRTRADAETRRLSAEPVRAVDTSGAGDVFCGTLAARLSLGESLPCAIHLAGAAAAIAVTRVGTFGSGPSAAEFQILLERESV